MPLLRLTDAQYRDCLKNAPECPLWQSLPWKTYQEALGRQTRIWGLSPLINPKMCPGNQITQQKEIHGEGLSPSALVIIDHTAFGLSTWDIPRGPIGTSPEAISELLTGIVAEAWKERCMSLYFSPSCQLSMVNCQLSARREQPEATLILDVTVSDEELLKQMKPKGRYNIRLAQRRGVRVEESQDIDAFYGLLRKTAKRDGFTIKPKRHYELFLRELPGSFLLLAYARGTGTGTGMPDTTPSQSPSLSQSPSPIAGVLCTIWHRTGYYYYGASDDKHRSLMAPYALQWEAMRICRARGCTEYDLLGILPPEARRRRAKGGGPHWEGITRFKEQFGGRIVTYPPEREVVLRPVAKTLIGRWRGLFRPRNLNGIPRSCAA